MYVLSTGIIAGSLWFHLKGIDPTGLVFGIAVIAMYMIIPTKLIDKKRLNPEAYGLRNADFKKNMAIGWGAVFIILPAFALLYIWAARTFTGLGLVLVRAAAFQEAGLYKAVWGIGRQMAINILFIGITEEIFFRCYVQTSLRELFTRHVSVKGVRIGPELFITAFLFGILHILWWSLGSGTLQPWGALVIIPGLAFGFLREWSKSYIAPAIFHGMCNATLFTLTGFALKGL